MRALSWFSLGLCLAAACGRDDGGGGGGADASAGDAPLADAGFDAAPSTYAVAVVSPGCAPDDGPAIVVQLGKTLLPDTCSVDDLDEHVVVTVYQSAAEIAPPETIDIPGDFAGEATYCPAGDGACPSATGGSITFDTFVEGESATGSYSLEFGVGGTYSGTFDAAWCDPHIVCGG